jgi:uncharacterized repeat protein (TIGR01451 family)
MLGRTLAGCAAAMTLAVTVTAPAMAATNLGQTSASNTGCGPSGQLAWQTSAPYLAPGPGVITQLRTSSGTPNATLSLKVIRSSNSTILFSTAPLTVTNAGDVVSVDVRVPVQQGDTLGFWLGSSGIGCYALTGPSDTYAGVAPSADQPAGPIAGSIITKSGLRIAVAATFETDADGDGYGDETQDSCPMYAAIHIGPCTADAGVSASATPASIEVGDIAMIDMAAANPGPGTVLGATLSATLPAGLTAVLDSSTACTFAGPFSCPLGDFGAGSRGAVLAVKGTDPGSFAVPVSLGSLNDPNPANNTTTVPIEVTAKPTPTPATPQCTVPALKGRTKSVASALLKAAGCKLGTTKSKKVKKGKGGIVTAQTAKAGSVVPLGTAVGVTLIKVAKKK